MFEQFKKLFRIFFSKEQLRNLRPLYHKPRAWLAALYYGFPGKELTLIGITGTKGKTSTVVFLGRLLNLHGLKTGYTSSAILNYGDFDIKKFNSNFVASGETLNDMKMSTIDPWQLQKYLRKMIQNGCKYAVLEMTSQGLEAGRHIGLGGFDLAMLTNLYPEHIEAHGSYANYMSAKSLLFKNLRLNGVFIGDIDCNNIDFMLKTVRNRTDLRKVLLDFRAVERQAKDLPQFQYNELEKISIRADKAGYQHIIYQSEQAETNFLAKFNAINLSFAWVAAVKLNLKIETLKLSQIWGVPGRMEWIVRNGQILYQSKTQSKLPPAESAKLANLSIMVDYAHEAEGLRQLLETLSKLKQRQDIDKIIHIFSVTGSGRDTWKRPQMSRVSAEFADYIVYTSEDHDASDDPESIKNEVLDYLRANRAKAFVDELDRFKALKLALHLAETEFTGQKVLIVSTAIGSQQSIETASGHIEWDEREKWLEALLQL